MKLMRWMAMAATGCMLWAGAAEATTIKVVFNNGAAGEGLTEAQRPGAHLQLAAKRKLTPEERDALRAELLRLHLRNLPEPESTPPTPPGEPEA